MDEISLRVGGREYSGWKSIQVTRSIEAVAGSFELSVSERVGAQARAWAINEEDECVVVHGNSELITGYVDKVALSYDATSHSLTVSGRDKTGDLVDCSALPSKWEMGGVPLLTLATRIAEPFGIPVTLQAGLTLPRPPAKFTIDPGDTAHDTIEKACRLAGLLPVSDGAGGLTLMRPGARRCTTELVEGENILASSADFDASGRYRQYVVMGQRAGTDESSGEHAASVKARAEDLNVRRSARVLVVRPEGNVTTELAKRRAQWEATTRAARGDTVSVTVQGWAQGNGNLWPINALVSVRSPWIRVDGDLLITQSTYTLDDGGTKTVLSLKRPDSFKPEPTITKASTTKWKDLVHGV